MTTKTREVDERFYKIGLLGFHIGRVIGEDGGVNGHLLDLLMREAEEYLKIDKYLTDGQILNESREYIRQVFADAFKDKEVAAK